MARGYAALYCRLSREDKLVDESNSIAVQKAMLQKAARQYGFASCRFFIDDGYSGGDFKRPGLLEMNRQIEMGLVSAVLVKDLSRLGRNYIEVGQYLENFLPKHNVRFISVAENLDSDKGLGDFVPVLNMLNDWYARDLGAKVRAMQRMRASEGIPLGQPPYGYIKSADDSNSWVPDEYAAKVVKKIYALALEGYGLKDIADSLEHSQILTPKHYWHSQGIKRGGKLDESNQYRWSQSTLGKMLQTQEYCGDIINFKTANKHNEKPLVFENAHEPIIERSMWEQVQSKRGKTRSRKTGIGKRSLFSGLLRCADCGGNMHFHVNKKNPVIEYFTCANYFGNGGDCPDTHYVRVNQLDDIVLRDIQRLMQAAQNDPDFWNVIMASAQKRQETRTAALRQELLKLQRRNEEIDALFARMFEDKVNRLLSDRKFAQLSKRFDAEQADNSQRINTIEKLIKKEGMPSYDEAEFIKIVKKHKAPKALTPTLLREFVEWVDVYPRTKQEGRMKQQLDVHYQILGLSTVTIE